MRHRPLSAVLLFLASSCARRDPAAPPRLVTAERPPAPPVAAPPVASLPPAPSPIGGEAAPSAEGEAALEIAGGVDVVGLRGRVDRLQIAASGERARLVAEVNGAGPTVRVTVAVELAADGALSPPAILTVGARGARLVASVAAAPGGFRTFLFGDRRTAVEAADFGNTHRFVVVGGAGAPTRSEATLFAAEEVVAASDGDRVAAASAGAVVGCFGARCIADDRQYNGFLYDPRSGYEVGLVEAGAAVAMREVFTVACADPDPLDRAGPPTLVDDQGGGTPPDRCRAQRRDRPYDVALALHGVRSLVAYRTARAVAAIVLGADGVAASPVVVSEGEVGAPAVAWRGDDVVMVWAQRASAAAPYALHAVEWNPATAPRPPAPTVLATGAASAFAPALLARGSQLVLAWMEGDDRAATVRVGSTRRSIDHAVDHAVAVSATGSNARDVELAGAGDRAWIAWSEYPGGRRREQGGGVVRASPLRLP